MGLMTYGEFGLGSLSTMIQGSSGSGSTTAKASECPEPWEHESAILQASYDQGRDFCTGAPLTPQQRVRIWQELTKRGAVKTTAPSSPTPSHLDDIKLLHQTAAKEQAAKEQAAKKQAAAVNVTPGVVASGDGALQAMILARALEQSQQAAAPARPFSMLGPLDLDPQSTMAKVAMVGTVAAVSVVGVALIVKLFR
jgi:hypothetical protein